MTSAFAYLAVVGLAVLVAIVHADINTDCVFAHSTIIEDGNGNPILQLSLSYNRSWAAIGRALERSGIVAYDRDRTAGIYYIPDEDYSAAEGEEAEGPGFFVSMFSPSEPQDALMAPSQVELRLIRLDGKIQVSVSKGLDTLLPVNVSKSLLTRLRDNLS